MSMHVSDGEANQAIHINRISKRHDGWAVYDVPGGDCAVAPNTGQLGDSADTVTVAAGDAVLGGTDATIDQQTVSIPPADSAPRKDVVVLYSDGSAGLEAGNPETRQPESRELAKSERPSPPDLKGTNAVPLAIVCVAPGSNDITNTDIIDVRPPAVTAVDESAITAHTGDTENPHSTTLEQARTAGNTFESTVASLLNAEDVWHFLDASGGSVTDPYSVRFDDRDLNLVAGGTGGFGEAFHIDHDTGLVTVPGAAHVGGDTHVTGNLTVDGSFPGSDGGEVTPTGRSTVRAVDHGADPTGTDPSTAALQAAVDAASPGDRVVWGETGTYYLDGPVTVTKRIELDLHEGEIESDYHDMTAYPDDQAHYMPLIRFSGSQGADHALTANIDRGGDQVQVSDPSQFSIGEGVLLRNETPSLGTPMPGVTYQPTITRIRDIADGVIYLEDDALRDYTTGEGAVLTAVDYIERPIIKNVHVDARNEPTFDTDLGKVVGGPRHVLATELTDGATVENCSVRNYDSHLWTSFDDRSPSATDLDARKPMNLGGSTGEPLFVIASNNVTFDRPKVKEARRGIDARAGISEITIRDPDITGISHIGISWHHTETEDCEMDYTVIGGRVDCKPTDPTQDNTDPDANRRYETQSGYPFNPGPTARFQSVGTDYVARNTATINSDTHLDGGSLYKYSTAATVLTINGDNVTVRDFEIDSHGAVAQLVEIDNGSGITLDGIALNASDTPAQVVAINAGNNIKIDGHVEGSASDRNVLVEGGTGIDLDLDIECSSNYGYLITGGEDIRITGELTGTCSNEQIEISGGDGISIDADLMASTTNARGVRIFGGVSNVELTGRYEGTGIGVMFSGGADGVTIHDMDINVTDGTRSAAIGSDGSVTGLSGVRIENNDLRGAVDTVLFNDAVTGLWVTDNTCSDVDYPAETTVGNVNGNMIY